MFLYLNFLIIRDLIKAIIINNNKLDSSGTFGKSGLVVLFE